MQSVTTEHHSAVIDPDGCYFIAWAVLVQLDGPWDPDDPEAEDATTAFFSLLAGLSGEDVATELGLTTGRPCTRHQVRKLKKTVRRVLARSALDLVSA